MEQNKLGTASISSLLRQLAIPAVIANVVNALYNIVDQIFIGQGIGYLVKCGDQCCLSCDHPVFGLGFDDWPGCSSSF